ncbi:MAG: hypothetical protein Q8O32_01475 [bacterium]|nr:hypothetical protein [bacterium]
MNLQQRFKTGLCLLPGEHEFVLIRHPCFPTFCYIWMEGLNHALQLGLSDAYLINLWENGLEVDWHDAEPLSEKNSIRVA